MKASKDNFEAIDGVHETSNTSEDDDTLEPCADETIADEEWLKRYRKEQEEKRRPEEDLTKRLENRVRVSDSPCILHTRSSLGTVHFL